MPDTKHRLRLFKRDRKLNICYIFSCDNSCNLDVVETLLSDFKEKHGIAILAFKNHFGLAQSSEMCESIISDLQMDFAIFVVDANQNQLSINEDIDGIGYARIYRALLKATGDRVIVVITGDNNYKNSAEEQSVVLSRWASGKMCSQFNVEFLDGRKSFIFSWDKKHRPIHEEAMMHFLDPEKKGERFVPRPNVELTVVAEDPKKTGEPQENETDVRAKTDEHSSDIQTKTSLAQKTQTRRKQKNVSVQSPQKQQQTEEDNNLSDEPYIDVSLNDVPMVDSFHKPEPARLADVQAVETSLSSSVAILYRDQTDVATIIDVFGILVLSSITINNPSSLKDLLLTQPVKSGFIVVEASKIREELREKSDSTPYQDLLKTARSTVERKVVVILCNQDSDVSLSEEDTITAVIDKLLGKKGCILWRKGNKRKGNVSVASPQEQQQTEEDMGVSDEPYVDVSHNDVPMEESLNKPAPALLTDVQAVDTSASSLRESVAILYRDQTDIDAIKDVFGDVLQRISSFTSDDPSSLKSKLLAQPVRSCFIIVETVKMREELHKKSHSTPYQDLLKTASSTVGKKVVVILCNIGSDISSSEEEAITGRIEKLLVGKGLIVWRKAASCPQTKRSMLSRSLSCPDDHECTGKRSAKKGTPTQVTQPINPEKLVLQTRLRHGRISYDPKDLKVMLGGWVPPQKMVDNLFKEFKSIVNVELEVYRNNTTGNERTVINKGITTHFMELGGSVMQSASSFLSSLLPGGSNDTPDDELDYLD